MLVYVDDYVWIWLVFETIIPKILNFLPFFFVFGVMIWLLQFLFLGFGYVENILIIYELMIKLIKLSKLKYRDKTLSYKNRLNKWLLK